MTEEVRAVCFPREDEVFVDHVRSLMGAATSPDEPLRAAIEATLRDSYPLAVVAARHPFAALDDRPTWYVYRDGGIGSIEAAEDAVPAVAE